MHVIVTAYLPLQITRYNKSFCEQKDNFLSNAYGTHTLRDRTGINNGWTIASNVSTATSASELKPVCLSYIGL